jgi:hypothetical protein
MDEEGSSFFIGDKGTLRGLITVRLSIDMEVGAGPQEEDRIELVELVHRQRSVANWSRADTEENGKKLEVSCPLTGVDSIREQSKLSIKEPKYLYVRLRMNGKDVRYPSNIASARGPWAWTSPIFWD